MSALGRESLGKLWESLDALVRAARSTEGRWDVERQAGLQEAADAIAEQAKHLPKDAAGAIDWEAVSDQQVEDIQRLRDRVRNLLDPDGPTAPPDHIMKREYASTQAVILLLLFGATGTIVSLVQVIRHWPDATGDVNDPAVTERVKNDEKATAHDGGGLDGGVANRDAAGITADHHDVGTTSARDGGPAVSAPGAGPAITSAEARAEMKRMIEETLNQGRHPIKERDLLYMIVLMGLLGGFVHLTSSLSRYVGNRQLLRSWTVWYLLMPFSGAALAPMVYLLLRVGVLSSGTDHLNVFGLYGFAALTGLFAEHAVEMLANVFAQIFTKIKAKDPMDHGKDS